MGHVQRILQAIESSSDDPHGWVELGFVDDYPKKRTQAVTYESFMRQTQCRIRSSRSLHKNSDQRLSECYTGDVLLKRDQRALRSPSE